MTGALVIGIGNPLRQDDGVGPALVQRLEQAGDLDVRLESVHQLTPEWAEVLAAVEVVVFVDASVELAPGQVLVSPVAPGDGTLGGHHLDPGALLGLTRRLFSHTPRAVAVAVGAGALGHGEHLGPEVAQAMPRVEQAVRGALA